MRRLLIFTAICFSLVLSCGLKNSEKEPSQITLDDYLGEYSYVSHKTFSEYITTTKKRLLKNIGTGKVVIQKNFYLDNNGDRLENPKYILKVITNSVWAMEPEPEINSYRYGFMTNRKYTYLLKIFDKARYPKNIYTQYELLDNNQILAMGTFTRGLFFKKKITYFEEKTNQE